MPGGSGVGVGLGVAVGLAVGVGVCVGVGGERRVGTGVDVGCAVGVADGESWDVRRAAGSQMGGVIEDWPAKRKLRASSEQHRSDRDTPKQAVFIKLRLTERASSSRVSACGSLGVAVLLAPPVEQNLALLVPLDKWSVTSRWWRSARV